MPILPSHRQGLYYLEHCRVMAKDERVVYACQEGAFTKFFAIPPANTNVILLGSGTSLTQAAARLLASEQVMVAFVGGGGSPLFLASQNEYRPTEYCQAWMRLWQDNDQRLKVAKTFQRNRAEFLMQQWPKLAEPKPHKASLEKLAERYLADIELAGDNGTILAQEAKFAKKLYKFWANCTETENFTRDPGKRDFNDPFNSYLDHGNYLVYGIAAAVLWVLGIPHSLPVIHGTTRRGALVFDVADIIKDTCVMPIAFQHAAAGRSDQEMRQACIAWLDESHAMTFLFQSIKRVAQL
ncbi:CRISPR-associated protein, Cas1 family [Nitrosococcus oceani ATCC 19707]|uniref:CRISPR-associated endonuclease Cas1 n=2 Tax=Nitrosococcus oceani TaxID=1229 RepID=Q3J7J6_NITOC|nr:type I-F CRISPR-associated endonuclease Cas1f [Nitrosococcus oceani]ABA59200.1 CRISPR-associated protein, Cas1 family [Nitrosococcus oceani ATCC 19707]EDZ65994.1 CRISPR-associated protein Cas1 [Nitrosococcus oceani AFC27]KFI18370.1 CRISPR-associated protein Cas1 [Nitrosococcus oceani C-27]GEM20265.1 subtype I-F CRISPR-associated endonuclease Cas1 [Nitrosococcus oceani]